MADQVVFSIVVDDEASSVLKTIESLLKDINSASKDVSKNFSNISDSLKIKPFADLGKHGSSAIDKISTSVLNLAENAIESGLLGALSLAKAAFSEVTSVITSIGSAVFEFGTDSVMAASDLQDSLSGVRKTANLTSTQVDELANKVRDLSVETLKGAVSTEELGEILEIAGQQGILAGDSFDETSGAALKFAEDVAKMATALDLSFSKAADRLSAFNSAFGGLPENIGNVANAFNVLADTTQANVSPMLEMARRLAPVVSQLPILQSEVIGLTGALSALKIGPQQASTALSSLFKKMNSDTKAFAEAFAIDFESFNKLVQTDTTAAFEVLLNNISRMRDSGPEGIQLVSQALKELSLTGQGVSTVLLGLSGLGDSLRTDFLDPASEGITNMDSITQEFLNSTARLSSIWEGLGAIMTDIKVILGTDVVEALEIIAGSNIRDLALQFREWLESSQFLEEFLPDALQRIIDIVDALTLKAIQVADSFRFDGAKDAGEAFLVTLESIREWIATLPADTIRQRLVDAFQFAADTARTFFDLVTYGFQNVDAIVSAGRSVWEGLKVAVEGVKIAFETVKTTANDLVSIFGPIISDIVGAFGGAADTIIGTFNTISGALGAFGAAAKSAILATISLLQGDLRGAINNVTQGISKVSQHIENMFSGLKSFFGGVIQVIKDGLGLVGSLASAIGKVTDKIAKLGDLATGNSVFPDMLESIGENVDALGTLESKISDNTKSMADLGMVATGNSTLPDMLASLEENNKAFAELQGAIQQTRDEIGEAKEIAEYWDNMADIFGVYPLEGESRRALYAFVRNSREDVMRAEAAMRDLLIEQQRYLNEARLEQMNLIESTSGFAVQGGQPAQQPAATGQQQLATVAPTRSIDRSIVVNFEGTNVVDENSLERFAARIGEIVKEQDARLVMA